ncbi:mannose-6-phosphate isomerase, class I [Glycomyces algeriensis]|uniref:mannose-6-phosphate isomerase n=1 Tax=Glycomyces algeriensis TaxID=256037 RepID=A0A9W6G7P7_9ACTN|nr:mannose-6-phosphate isomerase, class I [Glycomyces algeriensis]MDA1366118.1 mannose-6-phosphate isomerase, class I [Glycomyces algeriensis]MDR7349114.1 mannose-6-phosphate isomerase [Glycomyces algeriensis]GLI41814.1 mannose-6-phosphate isomerase, class I [Glycomyces algeriensis]
MQGLYGVIRNYAWGSQVDIAQLQGREVPADLPEAEEWLGAHHSAPSTLHDGRPLDDAIASAPAEMLGRRALDRFGPKLPFLLKLLAAGKPLSLQAHPNLRQANSGHQREMRIGIDAAYRNYVDDNHKPELLVALTEFRAMCGFRDPLAAAADIEALGVPELAALCATLRDPKAGLRRAVPDLLGLGREECRGIIDAAAKAAAELETADAADLVNLARSYPDDPGVLVSLLLNHITLQPGEGVYMPAGNLHAYLKGFGVEIMAASDNVLRGGLTNKRVDVPELLRVLDFNAIDEPRALVEDAGPVRSWPVPIADFALRRVELTGEPVRIDVDGPRICLSTGGSVTVADDQGEVALSPGRAAFSPGTAGPVVASGEGELFIASA